MDERDKFETPRLQRFRDAVRREFGPNLERATPANVRSFMDRFQEDMFEAEKPVRGRIELNESKTTYEEILKDFFARVLEKPSDEAMILLWTLAFEMSFFTIEQHAAERLQSLFGDSSDPDE